MNPKLQPILKQLEELTEDVCVYICFFTDGSWSVYAWDEMIFDGLFVRDEKYEPFRLAVMEILNDT